MASRAIKGRQGTKKKNKKAVVLSVVGVLAAVFVAGVIGVAALCQSWLKDLPDYTHTDAFNTAAKSTVYASDETTVLAELQLENRQPVTLDQISDLVKNGTVATEDERFYSHNGVDLMGIARAVVNNLTGGRLEGASTITQQFVRNTILSDEMTEISFKRKIREMYIALKLEEMYSKDEILLMYLNTINYGAGAYGIQAAADRYFSKSASDLTIAEAAALIGIPQSPTYNNPVNNMDNCIARRNVVLDRMVSNNVITQEEADAAKAESIVLNEHKPSETGILAYDYFTSYVKNQLMSDTGYSFTKADLYEGGLKIVTTLDVNVQNAAQSAADKKVKQAGDIYEVSLVAIDPDNGHIKAMIGGKDFSTNQVNMATGEGGSGRQSGSSFKTFTLLTAIEAGIDPETIIDAGATMSVPGSKNVSNIGGADYGYRAIKDAFKVSSNTAFVRLNLSLGPNKVIDMAHRLGIKSDLSPVATLTLGVDSVTPLEMSSAYSTIANGGTYYKPECVVKVIDRDGNVIMDNSNPVGERVISKEVAHAAVEVMKGVVTGGTGTAARLSTGQVAAGKTGTSDDYMDSWFCGITPQYSVAIWLGDRRGYIEGKPVRVTAASTFSMFLNEVLKDQPREDFPDADTPNYKTYTDEEYHIGTYTAEYLAQLEAAASSSSSDASSSDGTTAPDAGTTTPGTGGAGSAGGTGSAGGASPGVTTKPDPGPTVQPNTNG